jgi:hypothetical protein
MSTANQDNHHLAAVRYLMVNASTEARSIAAEQQRRNYSAG